MIKVIKKTKKIKKKKIKIEECKETNHERISKGMEQNRVVLPSLNGFLLSDEITRCDF